MKLKVVQNKRVLSTIQLIPKDYRINKSRNKTQLKTSSFLNSNKLFFLRVKDSNKMWGS